MGRIFETRIRHVRLSWSPFSAEAMSQLGTVFLDKVVGRIKQAIDVEDAPARPLTPKYKLRKLGPRAPNRGLQGIRDWRFTGWTLGSAKVKVASEDKVTIGFINKRADDLATWNNRRQKQWGVSPSDEVHVHAFFREMLKQKAAISVRRSA